jgi:hypothetical protein
MPVQGTLNAEQARFYKGFRRAPQRLGIVKNKVFNEGLKRKPYFLGFKPSI